MKNTIMSLLKDGCNISLYKTNIMKLYAFISYTILSAEENVDASA
jgi:hypothetical protein